MNFGECADTVLPQRRPLRSRCIEQPALLSIWGPAYGNPADDLFHDEEWCADNSLAFLKPKRLGHRHPLPVMNETHDPVLAVEQIVGKNHVRDRLDAHDETLGDVA